jgi:hypothetical protein
MNRRPFDDDADDKAREQHKEAAADVAQVAETFRVNVTRAGTPRRSPTLDGS